MICNFLTICHAFACLASASQPAQWLLLAQEAPGKTPAPAGDGALEGFQGLPLTMLLPIILLMFYFLVLRPQQQTQKQSRSQLENLKTKDRVITIGGIHGVVTNVQRDQEVVTIRVDETTGAKLRVGLSAIKEVVADEAKSPPEK